MRRAALAAAVFLAVATEASAARLVVGTGATLDMGTGSLDLGCADLDVGGTLFLSSGTIAGARDVTTTASGSFEGGSGTLELAGDWSHGGSFGAGSGTVSFADGCERTLAVISGDNTFENLSMATSSGKEYRFSAGSTQTIRTFLSLSGTAGSLLTLRSTLSGAESTFDCWGGYSVDFIDVEDIHASPNAIAPGPNSVTGANTPGWELFAVPALTFSAIAVLMLITLWGARRVLRRNSAPALRCP